MMFGFDTSVDNCSSEHYYRMFSIVKWHQFTSCTVRSFQRRVWKPVVSIPPLFHVFVTLIKLLNLLAVYKYHTFSILFCLKENKRKNSRNPQNQLVEKNKDPDSFVSFLSMCTSNALFKISTIIFCFAFHATKYYSINSY
jgi:hypothetical protein